ncbi:MAG: hypothetical protein ACLT3D_03815 [Lawsonibacter sp.]
MVDFPEEESVLSAFLKDITQKADRYADQMFQESERMDSEEVRRLEELIPGTDQRRRLSSRSRVRMPRKPEPPSPTTFRPESWPRSTTAGSEGDDAWDWSMVFLLAAAALFQPACPRRRLPVGSAPCWTGISSQSGSPPDCWVWGPSSPWMCSGRGSGAPSGGGWGWTPWPPCRSCSPWPTP